MTGDFAARLTARLCHDLANPLGAIGNGMELLTMSDMQPSPELDLIQDSLDQANGQLRLLRLAFGPASSGADARTETAQQLASIWNAVGRTKVQIAPDAALDAGQARLLALCLMCLDNALPAGGTITVTPEPNGFVLVGQGRKTMALDDLWPHLVGNAPQADVTSSRIHFLVAGSELAARSLTATVETTDAQVSLTLRG